jgi:hypothetical protein
MMPNNPRFDLLMANYARFDWLTLVIAGVALAAVLTGCMLARPNLHRYEQIVAKLYFGSLVGSYLAVMAGCAYLLLAP